MCYSAEASFIASGALAGCSVAIRRLPKDKSSVPLALVPAIFAVHQFVEGMIWLSQDEILTEETIKPAVLVYVLIAYVLWPAYVPLSALLLEPGRRRRAVILVCQGVGLFAATAFLVSIVSYPVGTTVDCCHIAYQVQAPPWLFAPYLLAVSVPFLVTSQRSLVLFGAGITLSCAAAAYLASAQGFPSVWCFFAALLSSGLYLHFRHAAQDDFITIASSNELGSTAH